MKQKIFITSLATVTACMVLGFIFSRFVLPVSAENGTGDGKSTYYFDVSSDYLTPQQFGASGEDKVDDTEAFRKLFAAAYAEYNSKNYSPNSPAGPWKRCKPIYIPSGIYYVSEPIVYDGLMTEGTQEQEAIKVRSAMFEVFGAGRESTIIDFTGDVLFDDHIEDKSDTGVVFAFSTFRDVGFDGNQENTFMYMASSNLNSNGVSTNGAQRLQFLSCGFSHFNKILECADGATQMLSEITFSYCRINDCGKLQKNDEGKIIKVSKPCRLFTLTCPQALNWRFDYTDIESIYGDVFYFKGATAITLNGGSIVIKDHETMEDKGAVFNFDYIKNHGSSSGNCPQVLCNGTRFEIWDNASLLAVKNNCAEYPAVTFRSCNLNGTTKSNNNLFRINGGVDALFEDCFGCSNMAISGERPDSEVMKLPTITFRDCSDLNVDNLVANSSMKGYVDTKGGHFKDNDNVRIIVDDSYDFYLYNHSYVHTVTGLNECSQQVNLDPNHGFNLFDLNPDKDKTVTAKPYGFVKYVELTVPEQINKDYLNGKTVTLTLYDKVNGERKQIGEKINITFGNSQTHMIVVNDYVEELEAVFTWPYEKKGASMNMTIVKY